MICCFFFQAEDGILDTSVTGVQTCALPIFSIIDGLKVSLDMEKGGEIATNLESLYDYMQRQLLMANLENKTQNLDEVLSLLNEIRTGWAQIPQDIRNSHKPEM